MHVSPSLCPGASRASTRQSPARYCSTKLRANALHLNWQLPMSLFDMSPNAAASNLSYAPLAERMRPRALDEFVGQEHLLAPGKPLRLAIERDDSTSMIFWGPPGTGKTTLAKIIAALTHATFIEFSAVMSGIKEIKQVMVAAEKAATFSASAGGRTILFIDEIHRFNKAQHDAFLPRSEERR